MRNVLSVVEAYDSAAESFTFGTVVCKIQYFWQWVTMNASIWTLAALSIDRYRTTTS